MGSGIRVLLVDDEELYAESLAKVLRRRGMDIVTAKDGPSALCWLQGDEADVIVLDLKMPGMDGIDTLKEIRKKDPVTPVIILTGHIDLQKVTRALEGGAGDILLKPCPVDSLVATIENAKERKAAAQGLQGDG